MKKLVYIDRERFEVDSIDDVNLREILKERNLLPISFTIMEFRTFKKERKLKNSWICFFTNKDYLWTILCYCCAHNRGCGYGGSIRHPGDEVEWFLSINSKQGRIAWQETKRIQWLKQLYAFTLKFNIPMSFLEDAEFLTAHDIFEEIEQKLEKTK